MVAHGGFGRRDLAPYSDADLMLLTTRKAEGLATKIAGDLTRDLVDAGIQPGFAIRSPAEACRLSWSDPIIFSSLAESRLLAGSLQLYTRFFKRFRHGAMRRGDRLIRSVVEARREERQRWGETNFLLRPNVKKSRGGLRDIQLVRWIGFARFGESELERLVQLGALPEEDFPQSESSVLVFCYGFATSCTFVKKKGQDVLDRPMQMAIAESWGYEGREGMLPVEQFMQDYFDKARDVRYASTFFVDDSRHHSALSRMVEQLVSRKVDEHIRMGPKHIWVPQSQLHEFASSLPDVLRLDEPRQSPSPPNRSRYLAGDSQSDARASAFSTGRRVDRSFFVVTESTRTAGVVAAAAS